MNDLRQPIGIFFLILGAILFTDPHSRARLTDVAVNLYAGFIMLVFGGTLAWLAWRRRS